MRYENTDKPMIFLQKALDKLIKYGMPTFTKFCDEVDLSYCDRNRVISKARVAYKKTEFSELPCPKELLGERWKFYTYGCGYSNEKATKMLSDIDNSYRSQKVFDFPDPKQLVRSIG